MKSDRRLVSKVWNCKLPIYSRYKLFQAGLLRESRFFVPNSAGAVCMMKPCIWIPLFVFLIRTPVVHAEVFVKGTLSPVGVLNDTHAISWSPHLDSTGDVILFETRFAFDPEDTVQYG